MDRRKVIKGLRCCTSFDSVDQTCMVCPYENDCVEKQRNTQLLHDALALLEEQKAILLENQHKPYGISTNANSPWISRCPRCGKKVEGKQTRYCKYCGQAVKWE